MFFGSIFLTTTISWATDRRLEFKKNFQTTQNENNYLPHFISVSSLRSVSLGPYTQHINLVSPASMYAEPFAWLTSPHLTKTGRTSTWSRCRPSARGPCEEKAAAGLHANNNGLWETSGPRTLLVSTGMVVRMQSVKVHHIKMSSLNTKNRYLVPASDAISLKSMLCWNGNA